MTSTPAPAAFTSMFGEEVARGVRVRVDMLDRQIAEQTTALTATIASDPLGYVVRTAAKIARLNYERHLMNLLVTDGDDALRTMHRWMTDANLTSDAPARLDGDLRAEAARYVADNYSPFFTDEQVRVVAFGARNRYQPTN